MKEQLKEQQPQLLDLLNDTLQQLKAIAKSRIQPQEAKARFNIIQKQYPETKIDLVWEQETYDRSIHYDALLHLCGEGSISLSFCPEETLPWPLRGVHRWSDKHLVRVNNHVLTVGEAIVHLDFIWQESSLMNRLIDICIIRQELEEQPVNISDDDLQLAMDTFRHSNQLYKAEDTYQWMKQHGMTHEKLEGLVADNAKVAKLKDRIAENLVEDYFQEHQANFETASIAKLEIESEPIASQIYEQIRTGKIDFYEAMEQHFITTKEFQGDRSNSIFSLTQRGHCPSNLAQAIFNAKPGDILEPIGTGNGYIIVRVLSFLPATLDRDTYNSIKSILFQAWLAKHREEAKIEWNWG
jgi:putative peptide maturation system protein